MRRQTEFNEAAAASRVRKLDPSQLPLRFVCPDANADRGERSVTLGEDRITLARSLGAVAMNIQLPLHAYRGVALRIVPGPSEAEDRVAVFLSHRDPGLDVPLFEAADDEDVIAEWRLWAETLALPLLMEGLDGRAVVEETRLGVVAVERPRPRRRYSSLAGRRPRFLTRRRTGKPSLVPFVHRYENEIIAPH